MKKAVLAVNDEFSLEQGISICVTKKLFSMKTENNGSSVYNKIVEKYGCRYYFEQATGLARETIKSYCLNKRHPNTVILEMLCRTLDVSADYLLFGEKRDRK